MDLREKFILALENYQHQLTEPRTVKHLMVLFQKILREGEASTLSSNMSSDSLYGISMTLMNNIHRPQDEEAVDDSVELGDVNDSSSSLGSYSA